jgi:anaerobic ribonucleoside-triphosphate reductase activating protein
LLTLKEQDGITLSGGDPFFQPEASAEIARFSKNHNLNVWAYTGYTFEELQEKSKQDESLKKLMQNIDVLVDGRFVLEQKSLNVQFRGSKNQRIIDMPKSLKEGKAVEIEKYNINQPIIKNTYGKTENMFI